MNYPNAQGGRAIRSLDMFCSPLTMITSHPRLMIGIPGTSQKAKFVPSHALSNACNFAFCEVESWLRSDAQVFVIPDETEPESQFLCAHRHCHYPLHMAGRRGSIQMQKTLGMVLSFFLSVAASAQPFFDASLKDPESLLVYTQTHPDFVRKSLKFRHDGADGFVEPYRSLFLALDLNDLPGTVRGQYKTVRMIYCSDIVSQVTAPFINGIIMKIFASPYISTSDAGCNITDDGDLYLPVGIISQQHYNAVWAHLAAIPELVDFLGGERFDLHVESFPEH